MKYRKLPIIVDVLQFTKATTYYEMLEFAGPRLAIFAMGDYIELHTLEGRMKASLNDYIVKGIADDIWAVKPHIFEQTYEKVEE